MLENVLPLFACDPSFATLTRTVCPAVRSRRKMSPTELVSPVTRLLPDERNAT